MVSSLFSEAYSVLLFIPLAHLLPLRTLLCSFQVVTVPSLTRAPLSSCPHLPFTLCPSYLLFTIFCGSSVFVYPYLLCCTIQSSVISSAQRDEVRASQGLAEVTRKLRLLARVLLVSSLKVLATSSRITSHSHYVPVTLLVD